MVSVTRITALAGGVGAAKLLRGLVHVVPPEDLTVIVNTGDDVELHGLHVSPDLDIIMYTLASLIDEVKGWGIVNDTFNCLEMLGRLKRETWFKLGDKDLAIHIVRTQLLRSGLKLSQVTAELCRMLGVKARLIPMTDDDVQTMVQTKHGILPFQEYFVKRGAKDEVLGVTFKGIEGAKPAPGVLEAISQADRIVLCPSNPIVSIGPILSIPGVRSRLREAEAYVVGVSPIVGGKTIKGPADRMMAGLGFEASAYGVAKLYSDFLDHLIIDKVDEALKERIEELGIAVTVTNTVMRSLQDSIELARKVLGAHENA
ncbi:MAG: 2-phospho-L-lactate transferase [Candidatus Nezhaarchaeales archaeon]